MSAPLSNRQKRDLSKLASRLFALEAARARGRGETPATSKAAGDAFRRDQVAAACGKLGLRCCSQDDYKLVEAHFLNLLGESGQAMNALVKHQTNPRRVAEYKLVQACEQAGLNLAYAAKICWHQFKCSLEDANEKQIWCLIFTMKNRGRKVTYAQEVTA